MDVEDVNKIRTILEKLRFVSKDPETGDFAPEWYDLMAKKEAFHDIFQAE